MRKMNVRKWLVMPLALSMAAVLVAGCGNGTSTPSNSETDNDNTTTEASADAKELQFYIWSDEENYVKKVVDAFNSDQSEINVKLTSIANDDYDDKLKVILAGDASVDIVDIRGMSQVTMYATADALVDLTEMVSASSLDTSLYGPMWDTSTVNDRVYAMPTRTTCWTLFYNKDLFDKADIDYPGQLTWPEYIDLSLELTDALSDESTETSDSIKGGFLVPWIYHFNAIQQGDYVNSDDTTALKESLELVKELFTNGSHFSYEQVQSSEYDYMTEFENGNAALLPNGEWVVNMLLEDTASGQTSVNWDVAPMPIPEGVEPGTTWGQFQFAAINSESENLEESFSFLEYLCGPEGSSIYSESGMIHAYASDESADVYKDTVGKDSVSVFFDAKKLQEAPNVEKYDQVLNAFTENAQLYLLDETDIETCMADFEEQRASILGE